MNTINPTIDNVVRKDPSMAAKKKKRGFTMAEILLVIVVIGILTAIGIPTFTKVRDVLLDSAKTRNADKLNEYSKACFDGGVDLTSHATGKSLIDAFKSGITVPASITGGQTMTCKLDQNINDAAYTFTQGTATTPPHFVPILNQRTVLP